jgi:hypothetical protein
MMVKIKDRWIRLIGVPLAALNSPYLYTELAQTVRFGFWGLYVIAIFQVWLIWEANRLIIKIARQKFPELPQTRKRVGYQLVICGVITTVIQTAYLLVHNQLPDWQVNFSDDKYWANYTIGLFVLIAILAVYEAVYFYRKLREKREETSRLKKEQVERQLENLKAQINPHFLFNSLNTLSSLIAIDAPKANHFLEEMATVYRYLIRNNEVPLCPLIDELHFIRAYFHLLQTRHGAGIQMHIHIPEHLQHLQIAPITLQLLVENAVKHNIVTLSKPLIINIFTENETLVIENNLQKKKIAVASHKVGLGNIIEKYALLGQNTVEVIENETTFSVRLPLI